MALLVEEERLTGSAARMLGAAIDIDVMEVVLRAALSKAGVLERAAEDGLTMGDVCSGIGTMAAAASRVTGGKLRYVFAAEKEAGKRRVLKAAWGAQGLPGGARGEGGGGLGEEGGARAPHGHAPRRRQGAASLAPPAPLVIAAPPCVQHARTVPWFACRWVAAHRPLSPLPGPGARGLVRRGSVGLTIRQGDWSVGVPSV